MSPKWNGKRWNPERTFEVTIYTTVAGLSFTVTGVSGTALEEIERQLYERNVYTLNVKEQITVVDFRHVSLIRAELEPEKRTHA